MMELAILAAVAFTGYASVPAWSVLAGAAALTAANWWRKLWLLRQHPVVPFSSKITTYFVISILINFGFAAASFLVGRILRQLLAG